VRRCGRSMNRQVRDRRTGMRLMEGSRELIPETRRGIPKGAIKLHVTSLMLVVERERVTRDEERVLRGG